ncbi:MAG: hypothetical protein OXU22_08640 [Gammaproteobacteria bacterium]|nr:hypothetical protein [Gammaproteobacteria bacterium]
MKSCWNHAGKGQVILTLLKSAAFALVVLLSITLTHRLFFAESGGHYVLSIVNHGETQIKAVSMIGFPERPGVHDLEISGEVLDKAINDPGSLSRHHFRNEFHNEKGGAHSHELKLRKKSALLLVFQTSGNGRYYSYINRLPVDYPKKGLINPLERTAHFPPFSLDGEMLEGLEVGVEIVNWTNRHHRTFSF